MEVRGFDVGVICLPYPGESVPGDMALVEDGDDALTIALADGLGHGPAAHASAAEALAVVRAHAGQDVGVLFRDAHQRLRRQGFRGAVLGLARFDRARRVVYFAGVGNIDLIVVGDGVTRLAGHHGLLGGVLPAVRTHEAAFGEGALAFLLSDGITTRFDPLPFRTAQVLSAQAIAEAVVRTHGRRTDDASAIVVRG